MSCFGFTRRSKLCGANWTEGTSPPSASGSISTNSITADPTNRKLLDKEMKGSPRLVSLIYAVPDHPWVASADGSDVRIAMTVGAVTDQPGTLQTVTRETQSTGAHWDVELTERTGNILPDLTIGADVAGTDPLEANEGISNRGVTFVGQGFVVEEKQARKLGLGEKGGIEKRIRPVRNGRDLTSRPRGVYAIDLFGLEMDEVRSKYPELYQWVRDRVKPERDQSRRKTYRERWWIFGEPRSEPVLISNCADQNERESAPFSVVNQPLTERDTEAMRKNYSSDLTDSQWQKVKVVLNTSRHRQHDLRRDILDAIFYLVKTGCQWRMLPGGFAPWQTVYYYFRTWKKRGAVARLLSVARRSARQEARREPEPSAVVIDCQSVPITRSGGLCGFDGNKKVNGRKRHIVTDTQGWTWAVKVHAANEHESQRALALLEEADENSGRLAAVFADKAYRGDLADELKEALGLQLKITTSESGEPGFSVEPRRWIVERTLGWFGGWRRLSKEYERLAETSEAMVRLASLRLAFSRL